jgi:DNA-directed RNA polymerase subunit RPC12/RpoP
MNPLDQSERQDSGSHPASASYENIGFNEVSASRGLPIRCQHCSHQSFRRSGLRSTDVTQILLMRYPVRCLRCGQRQMVSFTIAGISLPSARPQRTFESPTSKHWSEPRGDSGPRESHRKDR